MRRLVLLITLIASSWPALGQYTPQSITTTSVATPAGCASIDVSENKGSVGFYVGGTWTGTLTPEVAVQGQPSNSASASYVIPSASSTTQATITANGIYFFPSSAIAGASTAYVCGPTATGTALIWLNSSTALNVPPGSSGGGSGITSIFGNTGPAITTLVVPTGDSLTTSGSGSIVATSCPGCAAGSVAFSGITSGTNAAAAMVLGSGSSLTTSGTGKNTANQLASSTTIPNGGTITDAGGDGLLLNGTGFQLFNAAGTVNIESDTPATGDFEISWGPSGADTLIGTSGLLTSNVVVDVPTLAATTAVTSATMTATGLIKGNQLQSTVATGTAPLIVASTTNVANLNASSLNGATFAAPGAIGTTTAGVVKTTTLELPNVLCSSSSPSISSGFGTAPSVPQVNGTCAFTINVGSGGVATSGVIALNATASNGWSVQCTDITTANATVMITKQTATTTTTATIGNFTDVGVPGAWAASDILSCGAFGY